VVLELRYLSAAAARSVMEAREVAALFNIAEAGLWLAISVVLAIKARRSQARARRILRVLAGAFLLFSASDLIESRTGAWWQPWWLAALKVGCTAVFILGFRACFQIRGKP
jgi:hypothetical protein